MTRKVLLALLLCTVCQGFLTNFYHLSQKMSPPEQSYQYGVEKKKVEEPGPVDLPWRLHLYNPMLRGKRGWAGTGLLCSVFPCREAGNSMMLRDQDNSLHKILYSHV